MFTTLSSPILLYLWKDKLEVTQTELINEKLENEKKKFEDQKSKNVFSNHVLSITNKNFIIINTEQQSKTE